MAEALELRTVLILDDEENDGQRVEEGLQSVGRFVLRPVKRPTDKQLRQYLEATDLVVLDWHLDSWLADDEKDKAKLSGDNGALVAKKLLDEVLAESGVPVVIYTKANTSDAENALKKYTWYNSGLFPVVKKPRNRPESRTAIALIEKKAKEGANQSLSTLVGLLWKPRVRSAVNATVSEVKNWDRDVVALFADAFEEDGQDFALATRSLLNQMLDQYLPPVETLNSFLKTHVSSRILELKKKESGKSGKSEVTYLGVGTKVVDRYVEVESYLRYIDGATLKNSPLEPGDILVIDSSAGIYGIVITPGCDVVHSPNSTKLLLGQELGTRLGWRKGPTTEPAKRLISALETYLGTKNRSDKEEWLLGVPKGAEHVHIVFSFNWVTTVTTPRTREKAKAYKGLRANSKADKFERFEFPNTTYLPWGRRIARLRSPYLERLLDNYGRHQIRKGVPQQASVGPSVLANAYSAMATKNGGGEQTSPSSPEQVAAGNNAGQPQT